LAKLNFGIVPLSLRIADWEKLEQGDVLNIEGLGGNQNNDLVTATVKGKDIKIILTYTISERQAKIILKGGVINLVKHK
jgi:aconitate hydratase